MLQILAEVLVSPRLFGGFTFDASSLKSYLYVCLNLLVASLLRRVSRLVVASVTLKSYDRISSQLNVTKRRSTANNFFEEIAGIICQLFDEVGLDILQGLLCVATTAHDIFWREMI